ncbi:MAG: peptidoglycan DD-metalloendopeptidase family protein [Pseudomonadota bacterium]
MLRVLILLLFASPAAALTPAEEARAAMEQLDDAAAQLDAAQSGRDRVAALTETVQAFEDGLAAVRTGLRAAVLEEERLTAELNAKEAEVARLVGVLQVMRQRPTSQLLLHPQGPTGAARTAMILSDVTPALQAHAAVLREDLKQVANLRLLQQDAAARLRQGLIEIQNARATLSQAIADRTPLPKRFTEDSVKTAVLIAASETLEAFAAGLGDIATAEEPTDLPDAATLKGSFDAPVRGTILRRFGESDANGTARPGLTLATRPGALVTSPAAGTIRFQGALLDYGNVMILEPARNVLVVLAGLSEVYVCTGDVVTTGAPLGLVGSGQLQSLESPSTERSETLYIEVREEEQTADPETWFALERNE